MSREINNMPRLERVVAAQRCIANEEHACRCSDANCTMPNCQKMKRILVHFKTCKKIGRFSSCVICKQLFALNCYHATKCQVTECPLPLCKHVKYKLKLEKITQSYVLKHHKTFVSICGPAGTIKQASPGTSNTANRPSPDNTPSMPMQANYRPTPTGNSERQPTIPAATSTTAATQVQSKIEADDFPNPLHHYVPSVEHACRCRDANCTMPKCQKMKIILVHFKTCKNTGRGCASCRLLIALNYYHAKKCQVTKCPLPLCENIKLKLQKMTQSPVLKHLYRSVTRQEP